MIVLILGGQGNLGTQLFKVFKQSDFNVVAWDKEDVDALNFSLLKEKVLELKPDVIINAIAYNAVDKCEEEESYKLALLLNKELPKVLTNISLEIGSILIHYSTDYVFSGTEDKQDFFETDIPNPINKYGESKFFGEQEVLAKGKDGLKYYLIRTSKLFGPLGKSPLAKKSFFDIMLDLAKKKEEIAVVKGELSCFTYTPDLALETKKLISTRKKFGIYHIINSGPVTWYDGAIELFRRKKIEIKVKAIRSEDLNRLARRPEFSVLKNTKLSKLRSWKEALKEYLCEV